MDNIILQSKLPTRQNFVFFVLGLIICCHLLSLYLLYLVIDLDVWKPLLCFEIGCVLIHYILKPIVRLSDVCIIKHRNFVLRQVSLLNICGCLGSLLNLVSDANKTTIYNVCVCDYCFNSFTNNVFVVFTNRHQ